MSAQGGSPSARTKAARDNGQKPKKSAESETFDKPEEDNATAVHPMPTAPPSSSAPPAGAKPAPTGPKPTPADQHDGRGASSGIRPSLTSEAPPQLELSSSKKKSSSSGARLPRKAHLVLRRIEPWSAMKFSFVVSLVCFVVLFVAVAVLYGVLSALGVFDSIVDLVNQLGQGEQGQTALPIDIASWFEPVRILGYTALIGAVNVVLITALATLGSVIYNVASDLVGGVEVTFSEAE
ncbi:DUF3566 domain-containing protein [Nonomuraea sp. NPDC005501]|uniref:DUF3566 domain-containing protein n=1 Tax=Nonomuraea sp. NPDC005501 TaxID=3156884 RepID=UPI0033A32CDE